MNKSVPVIGFLILSIVALLIYGFAVYNAWTMQPIVAVLITVGLIGLLYTLIKEGQGLSEAKADNLFSQKNLLLLVAVMVGAVASEYLGVDLKLGAVLGSAIVGIVAALVIPDYAVPVYTGSFVGMASTRLLPGYAPLVTAAVVAGIIYVLTLTVFGGFGGKLGTIAATGCIFACLTMAGEFSSPAVPTWDVGTWIIIYAVLAAGLTYYLNNTRKHGAVLASSVVGLVAGVLLPGLHGDPGKALAVVAICASFVGMSNTKRFPTIVPMLFAGLAIGLVYMYSSPFLGGTGGKLGTIAFGSGMAIRGLMDLIARFQGGIKS